MKIKTKKHFTDIHSRLFLDCGGDPEWLQGTEKLPPKIQAILPLNQVMAHQPWLLSSDNLGPLVKTGSESWSLNELVQAMVIMTHFHALTSFAYGCGKSNPHII